jgi:hypothetical protein
MRVYIDLAIVTALILQSRKKRVAKPLPFNLKKMIVL